MCGLFFNCSELDNLDLSNFNLEGKDKRKIYGIFGKCSELLKQKIRNQKPNIEEEAFGEEFISLFK